MINIPFGTVKKWRWTAPGNRSGLLDVRLSIFDDAAAHITGSPFAASERLFDETRGIYETIQDVTFSAQGRYLLIWNAPSLGDYGLGLPVQVMVGEPLTGGGIAPVTIKVMEQDGVTPIPETKISIMNAGRTLTVAYGITGVDGIVSTFALGVETYKVVLKKLGVDFNNPYTIVVPVGGGVFLLKGDTIVVEPPADPELCRIYGFVADETSEPLEGVEVKVKLIGAGIIQTGRGLSTYVEKTVETDEDGLWKIDLFRGRQHRIKIPTMRQTWFLTVPEQSTYDFLDAASGGGGGGPVP